MRNSEKYSRVRDVAIFLVVALVATVLAYLLGEMRGRIGAELNCDAIRAERIERHHQLQQKGVPLKKMSTTGEAQTWGL